MVAAIPRLAAAVDTPMPWLPEDAVTTPSAAVSASSECTKLAEPRTLKLPVSCRCSDLIRMSAPCRSDNGAEWSNGVRNT